MTCGGTMQLSGSSNVPVVTEQLPWTDCPINTAGNLPAGRKRTFAGDVCMITNVVVSVTAGCLNGSVTAC